MKQYAWRNEGEKLQKFKEEAQSDLHNMIEDGETIPEVSCVCINFLHETLRSRTAAGTTSYCLWRSKVGKSELVGELTKYFNLFWFSLDGGHSVLYKLSCGSAEKIRLIVLPDTGDYPIAAETCRKVMKPGAYQVCLQHGKVSCFLCLKEKNPIEEINLHALDLDWIIVWDNLSQLEIVS